jgi:ribonucleoside-diphosphate reductase alpha chain
LPDTRQSVTHKFNVAGHEGYITVGLFPDGRPGELFITMAKEGSTIGGLMDCFGTAVSMSWQYGVPLEVYVNKFSHTRFEPMGHTKNPDIRIAKSIVDYIFRWLGITFLPGYREANLGIHVEEGQRKTADDDVEPASKPAAKKDGGPNNGPGSAAKTATEPKPAAAKPTKPASPNGTNGTHNPAGNRLLDLVMKPTPDQNGGSLTSRADQFASFQADAPSCDNCGAITVRNGNCYLCHNCGNSMGCS